MDAERPLQATWAIGHQQAQQVRHRHIPTVLGLEGLHSELLAPLA
jgi:hypothetical protein